MRVSSFIVRVMLLCNTFCSASSVGAGTSTKTSSPSGLQRYTPSLTDCGWSLGASCSLGLLEEGSCVPLHQAVQGGLLRAVAIVVMGRHPAP